MIEFLVKDMTCGHCAGVITKALEATDAAAKIDIDIATHAVRIESQLEADTLADAIRQAGYSPEVPGRTHVSD